jgi:hypothetical protein
VTHIRSRGGPETQSVFRAIAATQNSQFTVAKFACCRALDAIKCGGLSPGSRRCCRCRSPDHEARRSSRRLGRASGSSSSRHVTQRRPRPSTPSAPHRTCVCREGSGRRQRAGRQDGDELNTSCRWYEVTVHAVYSRSRAPPRPCQSRNVRSHSSRPARPGCRWRLFEWSISTETARAEPGQMAVGPPRAKPTQAQ